MKSRTLVLLLLFSQPYLSYGQWVPQASGTTDDLYSVYFTDDNTGCVVGENGTILKTTNGGVSWVNQVSGTVQTLYGVSFTSSSNGIVVGDGGTVLVTSDGGSTWGSLSIGTTQSIYGVSFVDGHWTAVGNGGLIIRDGNTQNSGTTHRLGGVSFIDENVGTAVGGEILRTTDGGENWEIQLVVNCFCPLVDVSLVSADFGMVVGYELTWGEGGEYFPIGYRTTDGGNNWRYGGQFDPADWLGGVSFIGMNTGIVVGGTNWNNGVILRTTDGGQSWVNQTSGTWNELYSVFFTKTGNTGVAVGKAGTILRTTNGGTTFADEESETITPEGFTLFQNYPNPCNPITTISYQLATQSPVMLKVYDLLGREVTTLVNEIKPPGSYEVTWDASGVSSGVYFYRLLAGDFVATRRLMLLK